MTTTQPTAEQLRMARECAVSAVSTKLPGLMGNDFKGNIPKLRARIAKMRCAEGDHFVEVQSALLAIQATEARMAAAVEAERARCSKLAADYAASMTPTIRLGDEDSIYLTDHEQGQKDAAKRLSIMIYKTAIRSQSNG